MILIGVQEISKAYSKPLFKGLSFSIESGDKVGLIGPNGAGKSTLLKILSGQLNPDSGSISIKKGMRIGFLEQIPEFHHQATIRSTISEGIDSANWEELSKVDEWISKMDLNRFDSDALVSSLSGGWRKRVALGRELIRDPEILLLDEPTNHLDLESIMWLEEFLEHSSFATLTISHDRLFLQRVSNRIIELDRRHDGGLLSVCGSYLDFLEKREEILAIQELREVKLANTLRRETEWLRRGAQGRQTKQKARMEAARELENNVNDLKSRNKNLTVRLDFKSTEKAPKKLIEAIGISKSYNDTVVVPKFDLLITPKSRIGLVGPNGCGKSTLIKLLTKVIEPDSGKVIHADQLKISYFEQNRESLDPELTVLRTLCPTGERINYAGSEVHIKSYLSRFLFSYEQMDAKVQKLSGGEQSRLLLAKLMLSEANLLVLDEPTNDLDLATLDVLADVLSEFNGAILLVTHDRYFLDEIAHGIIAFGNNKNREKELTSLVGLDQLEAWQMEQRRDLEKPAKRKAHSEKKVSTVRLSYKEQFELENMEETIEATESYLAALISETSSTGLSPTRLKEISLEMDLTQKRIDELYQRWADLESRLKKN